MKLLECATGVGLFHHGMTRACSVSWRYGMADVLTPEQRRLNMSRIRGRDTRAELLRRRGLHGAGAAVPPSPERPARAVIDKSLVFNG